MSILIIWIFYLISGDLLCFRLIFIDSIIVVASTAIDSDFKVTINAGTLKGHLLKTANEREFIGFEGIPYAQPPIGNLRFEVRKAFYCIFFFLNLMIFSHLDQ